MPKEEWGTKRVCPTTGKRFYDLNRNPIVSPYTGEVVTLDTGSKSRTAVAEKATKRKEPEAAEDNDVDLEEDDSADVDLADDILDDDDDDDNVSLDDIADVSSKDDES